MRIKKKMKQRECVCACVCEKSPRSSRLSRSIAFHRVPEHARARCPPTSTTLTPSIPSPTLFSLLRPGSLPVRPLRAQTGRGRRGGPGEGPSAREEAPQEVRREAEGPSQGRREDLRALREDQGPEDLQGPGDEREGDGALREGGGMGEWGKARMAAARARAPVLGGQGYCGATGGRVVFRSLSLSLRELPLDGLLCALLLSHVYHVGCFNFYLCVCGGATQRAGLRTSRHRDTRHNSLSSRARVRARLTLSFSWRDAGAGSQRPDIIGDALSSW